MFLLEALLFNSHALDDLFISMFVMPGVQRLLIETQYTAIVGVK